MGKKTGKERTVPSDPFDYILPPECKIYYQLGREGLYSQVKRQHQSGMKSMVSLDISLKCSLNLTLMNSIN